MTNFFLPVIWSLRANLSKSVLAAIVLSFGLTSVTLGFSIVNGYQAEIEKMTFGSYAKSLVIRENMFVDDLYGPPNIFDSQILKTKLRGINFLVLHRRSQTSIQYKQTTLSVEAIGFSGRLHDEIGFSLYKSSAKFHSMENLESGQCVLGYRLAAKLKLLSEPKLSQKVFVNGFPCNIAGVLTEPENRIQEQYGMRIIMPIDFLIRYVETSPTLSPQDLDQITLVFQNSNIMKDSMIIVDKILRKNHGIPQSQLSGYTYVDTNFPIRELEKQRNLMTWILSVIGLISATTSILGFGVIWLNMINSRRSEIATQLAVGATVSNIILELVSEISIITLFGIIIAYIFSSTISELFSSALQISVHLSFSLFVMLSVLTFCVAIGILLNTIVKTANMPLSRLVK